MKRLAFKPSSRFLLEIPKCQHCKKEAKYHAKTISGPWEYLCLLHWRRLTNRKIGVGFGYMIELRRSAVLPTMFR